MKPKIYNKESLRVCSHQKIPKFLIRQSNPNYHSNYCLTKKKKVTKSINIY